MAKLNNIARMRNLHDSSEDLFDDSRAPAPSCPRVLAFDQSSDERFLFGGRTRASIGVPHAWLQHVYADYMQTSTGVIEVYELTKNKANGPLLWARVR